MTTEQQKTARFEADLIRVLKSLINGEVRISHHRNDMLSEHCPKVIEARALIARAEGQQ